MRHDSLVRGDRPRTGGIRVATVALISLCLGCGSDGPTEPVPTTLADLFGTQLLKADGSQVGVGSLSSTPLIGVYFASPTCPACSGFTPQLVEAYNQWEADGQAFEVVLVTSGVGQADLLEYMTDSNMPWRAVSPQSNKASSLIQRYNVRWVPTLVVIDSAMNTVTMTGREEVVQMGAGIYDVWIAAVGGG